MKVLFAVSECVPFVKSGGLADVAGALPKELVGLGTDVRVILPKYGMIADHFKQKMNKVTEFSIYIGWREQYCGIETLEYENVTYYFVDNEYYFKRPSLYGHFDDGERFAFFNRAVLDALPALDFQPDVIHCHDWHTGMVPFLLREYKSNPFYTSMRTVFTIHNLQFQGIFPKEIVWELFNLRSYYLETGELEFHGAMSFMKGALMTSDVITTVSPTYKEEIQIPYYGEKLDGLLRSRSEQLTGILNGIDDEIYNPASDDVLVAKYSRINLKNKVKNKLALQRQADLPQSKDIPMIGVVSRLTKQKGLDLIKHVFHEIVLENIQFVVIGTGDAEFEGFFKEMERQYPNKVRVHIGFNESLAHQIYASSDMFLMPSKFEPCGLGQLIALRYGAIPIVRETGGLNDTVQSFNEHTGKGNGFSFAHFNAHDMLNTIRRALHFYQKKEVWNNLVKESMGRDYSWAKSAFKYNQLYATLTTKGDAHVFEQREL